MTIQLIDGPQIRIIFSRESTNTISMCEMEGRTYCAIAHLAKTDRFVKAKGRRVALARLLSSGLLRDVDGKITSDFKFIYQHRCQVWAEYFRVHADLKKKAKA